MKGPQGWITKNRVEQGVLWNTALLDGFLDNEIAGTEATHINDGINELLVSLTNADPFKPVFQDWVKVGESGT